MNVEIGTPNIVAATEIVLQEEEEDHLDRETRESNQTEETYDGMRVGGRVRD